MPNEPMELPGFEGLGGVELLNNLPLFKTLAFEETRRLFAVAERAVFGRGAVIIEENELGRALYVVRSGRLRATHEGVEVGVLGPGELVGEMSLVDDLLTSARVEVVEDAELLVLPRPAFEALMAREPELALKVYRAFCRTLSERLRRLNALQPGDRQSASAAPR